MQCAIGLLACLKGLRPAKSHEKPDALVGHPILAANPGCAHGPAAHRGRSGQEHSIELTDRRLANIVKQCRDLPGNEVFQYIGDDGRACAVDSANVNRYIRDIAGRDFRCEGFPHLRWYVLAVRELCAAGPCRNETAAKRAIVNAAKSVARQLGNRPATCRKYYVHPATPDAYADGSLFSAMRRGEQQQTAYNGLGLRPDEYCVMVVVAGHQEKLARQARA
jgi:DNA topoisomerase I